MRGPQRQLSLPLHSGEDSIEVRYFAQGVLLWKCVFVDIFAPYIVTWALRERTACRCQLECKQKVHCPSHLRRMHTHVHHGCDMAVTKLRLPHVAMALNTSILHNNQLNIAYFQGSRISIQTAVCEGQNDLPHELQIIHTSISV